MITTPETPAFPLRVNHILNPKPFIEDAKGETVDLATAVRYANLAATYLAQLTAITTDLSQARMACSCVPFAPVCEACRRGDAAIRAGRRAADTMAAAIAAQEPFVTLYPTNPHHVLFVGKSEPLEIKMAAPGEVHTDNGKFMVVKIPCYAHENHGVNFHTLGGKRVYNKNYVVIAVAPLAGFAEGTGYEVTAEVPLSERRPWPWNPTDTAGK